MVDTIKIDKILRVLETPTNMATLLAAMSGFNYATKISKLFKIKQPVITRRLKDLAKVGLTRPKRAGKTVVYRINWEVFLNVFYHVTNLKLKENTRESVRIGGNNSFSNLKAEWLSETFLKEYFSEYIATTTTVLDIDLEIRGLNQSIDQLFVSLEFIHEKEDKDWKTLIRKYNLDEKAVSELIYQYILVIAIAGIVNISSLSHL